MMAKSERLLCFRSRLEQPKPVTIAADVAGASGFLRRNAPAIQAVAQEECMLSAIPRTLL
jgi:hypothetical protein